MEKTMIPTQTTAPAPAVSVSSNPQPTTLFTPNGIKYDIGNNDDIELISLHALTYTSLRDILPPNRSPSSTIMSPTSGSSWYEVPTIKNPLVKQAALSYLQPMSIPPESDDRSFFRRMRDMCCCSEFGGCFVFFTEVVVWKLKQIFSERHRDFDDDDDDDDYDYDDYDYVYHNDDDKID